MNYLDKISDAFMFRSGTEEDSHSNKPVVTTGSIVWGVILRSFLIITISIFLLDRFNAQSLWWFVLFALWVLVAFPAYKQYQVFNKRMEEFEESTLCGQCRHFDSTSQVCRLYDEHVSKEYIPCEGSAWEPK